MFYFASVKFIKKNACPMSLYGFIININKGFYRNISLFEKGNEVIFKLWGLSLINIKKYKQFKKNKHTHKIIIYIFGFHSLSFHYFLEDFIDNIMIETFNE